MGYGEWTTNNKVTGLTWKSMCHHYAIIPVIGFSILGMAGAGAYLLRLATKHPEVSWTRGNPEPWNEYACKQYKFLSSGRDYSICTPAPNYK